VAQPNVICLHEQDNGIGWKHTNWRTGRAVVTRHRELVVQFILTLANYEYVFAYKFNLAGGIEVETRATGIVSCVNIDAGKTSEYGNVVHPGVLAQNHQHIFAIRIDPAIDGHKNTVVQEESLPVPMNAVTNPHGNMYKVVQTPFAQSGYADLDPTKNRIFKIINQSKKNPMSGKPVGYKLVPPATQLLLADPRSRQAKRAAFARHHVWVTRYQEGELWAAGKYPYHSNEEEGGVQDMVERGDSVENEDIVVWSVFGLTHNPRTEDWPVMYVPALPRFFLLLLPCRYNEQKADTGEWNSDRPVEIHSVHLVPSDFFTANPALDVPSQQHDAAQQVATTNGSCCDGEDNGGGNAAAETNGANH
jgi:primary-amine oxidase